MDRCAHVGTQTVGSVIRPAFVGSWLQTNTELLPMAGATCRILSTAWGGLSQRCGLRNNVSLFNGGGDNR